MIFYEIYMTHSEKLHSTCTDVMFRCTLGMMGKDEVMLWCDEYLHEEAVLQRGDVLAVSARLG